MTQQTAEPGSFLPLHSLPSGPPKHARFGSCCAQQSSPVAALMWPVTPGKENAESVCQRPLWPLLSSQALLR